MIWLMIGTMFAGSLFLACCTAYGIVKLKDNPLEHYVRRALSCAAVVTAANAAAMLMPSETSALFVFGIYNIFETLTVMSLLSFARHYLGHSGGLGRIRLPVFIIAGVDSLFMLLNVFLKFSFKVENFNAGFGKSLFRVCDYGLLYCIHSGFVVSMMTAVLIMLLHRMLTAPKAYAIKYSSVFLTLLALVAISMLHIYLKLRFDYSIALYSVEGFIIFYYSLLYVPRGLMERLMFFTVANMKDGMICIDIDGRIVQANKAAKDFCEADIDVQTLEEQVRRWKRDDVDVETSVHIWETTRRISGEKRYYTIEYRRIYDSYAKYLGCFFLVHDRTEEVVKFNAENYRATHDKLTGLYNKEYFFELVEKLLKDNPAEKYNIIVTDVKNFKIVNDVFGVDEGDRLLKKIAEITMKFGGNYCIYGRLTGDRFALCIPKNRYSEEKLLRCYSSADSFIENASFKTHIHIGVYEVTDRNIRVSVMCDRANLAIRTIKDSFRSRVAYYQSELRENFIGDHRIISEFETSIANGHFRPYIQPQIAADGSIRGGETLVRWLHPEEGMIRPDKFIKILEQTGLISRLDKYMWELACVQLKRWTEMGLKKSYLSVNISQKDFYLLDVFEVITSLVKKYDIAPKRLHLEVTETAIMDNPENHLRLIAKLRKHGFIVEIDDFGSGYSSLNMLKDLDADVLKIDMGFLQKTRNQEKSRTILKMIISLAKSLKMEVITEGVETIEQVKFLAEYGCDVYQGYYFAQPMPVDEFESGYLNKRFRMRGSS